MKPDNLLRAASTLLLLSLNIIGTMLFSIIGDLRSDVRTLNSDMKDIQIRIYGAEKDIKSLQSTSPVYKTSRLN